MLKFNCRILKVIVSLGLFAGIAQFVELEVENLLLLFDIASTYIHLCGYYYHRNYNN